ncbi:unnamed protein product [Rodentolepis nana]|uniref:DCAF15_WD40 domain-containing protein n=1 Tax=Rodentolepis nana TaxID=102285 RepID=A0A0R3T092_RODNA|nr:unnamed protein product [Rodentolepis nana]
MSKEAPPIMRKLLIGQLANLNYGSTSLEDGGLIHSVPFPPNRQLLFSLVWLQGHVLGTYSSSSNSYFLLDDGTGSIIVKIQPDTELPSLGTYVSAVGEISRDGAFIQSPFDDFSSSLKTFQFAARSVMCLSLADNHFPGDEDSFPKSSPPSVYAELSWPLEVLDMSRNFSAPF